MHAVCEGRDGEQDDVVRAGGRAPDWGRLSAAVRSKMACSAGRRLGWRRRRLIDVLIRVWPAGYPGPADDGAGADAGAATMACWAGRRSSLVSDAV